MLHTACLHRAILVLSLSSFDNLDLEVLRHAHTLMTQHGVAFGKQGCPAKVRE